MTATPRDDDNNPFAPPQAVIGTRASEIDFDVETDAELIRRHHLSHEASIKSLGLLSYLGAMLSIVFALAMFLSAIGVVKKDEPPPGTPVEMWRFFMGIGSVLWTVVVVLGVALGYGLRHLQVWARWMSMVLLVLALLYCLAVGLFLLAFFSNANTTPFIVVMVFGIAIQGYIFYLLIAPKSGVIFSADYRMVIAKTPEIACRTGLIVKIGVGLLVVLIFLALLGVISTAFGD